MTNQTKHCNYCGESRPEKFMPSQKYKCRRCIKIYNQNNKVSIQKARKKFYTAHKTQIIKNNNIKYHKNKSNIDIMLKNKLIKNEALQKIHQHYNIIEYNGSSNHSVIHCNKHNIQFEATISSIMKPKIDGHITSHCPSCVIAIKTSKYITLIADKNPTIKLVGQLSDNKHTPQLHKCIICDHHWLVSPGSVQKGKYGCPECNKQRRSKSSEQYQQELIGYGININVIGEYIQSHTPLQHECPKCKSIDWYPSPNSILTKASTQCLDCSGSRKKTIQQYQSMLQANNVAIKIIGDKFNGMSKSVQHECPSCKSTDWYPIPSDVLNCKSTQCRNCANGANSYTRYKSKRTKLYYIKVDDMYKIGLTQTEVNKRYYKEINNGINIQPIREWVFTDGYEAYKLEQKVLRLFNHLQYTGKKVLINGGNTELFSSDILEEIESLIELTLLEVE